MTNEEAIHKLRYSKKAYQMLIDEKVDSGKLIGDGVMGEWKAETPLDEAYKSIIEALDMAIKALEQQPETGHWILADEQSKEDTENNNYRFICSECGCADVHAKSIKVPYCWSCGVKMEVEE